MRASIGFIDIGSQQNLALPCKVSIYAARMELREWVKAARKHKNWTQTQLGDELGVTKGNVSAWEVGRHEPSYGQMQKISDLTSYEMPKTKKPDGGLDWHTVALGLASRWSDAQERPLVMHFVKSVASEVARLKEIQADSEISPTPMKEEGITL